VTPTNNFNDLLDSFKTDFEDLVLSIQGKRVIFFVGAGISRAYPTNLETAKDLVSRFKDLFGSYGWWTEYFNPSLPDAKDKFYDEGFEFPRLEEIAELFLTRDQFPLFIDSLMQDSRWELEPPNVCHTVISELLIEEICQGVLTTNVDNRIETEHLRISDQSALHVISHDDFIARKEYQNDIYKIHGCLYQCPTRKYCSIWAKS